MASGSSSPASDGSSKTSEPDSPIIKVSDDNYFHDVKVVIGLPMVAAGGKDLTGKDEMGSKDGDGVVAPANEGQLCIGTNNDLLLCGYCTDQGVRRYMEDRYKIIPAFLSLRCNTFGGCTAPHCEYALGMSPVHYFAVFDGHGGWQPTITTPPPETTQSSPETTGSLLETADSFYSFPPPETTSRILSLVPSLSMSPIPPPLPVLPPPFLLPHLYLPLP
ncbi:unnamed protein product [Lactuca saligna]|uniref:Uncharacterized protein n=1 Tax=Lactuca saligna TaxID=75948 RepID=A0AA35YW85_LACSI|nr:unnamed protein product [Lactuca saligna]